jgi:hypothetical protein
LQLCQSFCTWFNLSLFPPLSLSCQMKIVSFCNSIPSSYCYNF